MLSMFRDLLQRWALMIRVAWHVHITEPRKFRATTYLRFLQPESFTIWRWD